MGVWDTFDDFCGINLPAENPYSSTQFWVRPRALSSGCLVLVQTVPIYTTMYACKSLSSPA